MYQPMIREDLARLGVVGQYDPRHVEGWMRAEHETLDGLSRQRFAEEVVIAVACIDAAGADQSEQVARSFGL